MVTNYGGTGDLMCSSTDVKPTDVAVNTRCLELDTGKFWYFNGTTWTETPGGGGGSATLIEKSITANGTYDASSDDADGYSSVDVNVPNTYTVGDNGKVVSNQQLVSQTAKPDTITVNDTYNTTEYNSVTVNVPNTYTAQDEGKVVSSGALVAQTAYPSTIVTNGTYDTTLNNSVTVDVPSTPVIADEKTYFHDYDGSIVYEYTKQEFMALNEMPSLPTHNGLTAQGWNWTLSDAKTFVDTYGALDIGAFYITDDGKTRFYVTITEQTLSLYITFSISGNDTWTISWGDNTSDDTFTGSASTNWSVPHTYASPGNYVIRVWSANTGTISFIGDQFTVSSPFITGHSGTPTISDRIYAACINRIELGVRVGLNSNAFTYCTSLTSISTNFGINRSFKYCSSLEYLPIHSSVEGEMFRGCVGLKYIACASNTSLVNQGVFRDAVALQRIVVPSGTTVSNYSFYNCRSLRYAMIGTVRTVSDNAFYNCISLKRVTMKPTTIGTYAFYQCRDLVDVGDLSNVTTIGSYAFSSCTSLDVDLPTGLQGAVDSSTFTAAHINRLTIPTGISEIKSDAFYNCRYLTSLTFPTATLSVGNTAFRNCERLTTVTIPQGVSLVYGAFYECSLLQDVVYNSDANIGNNTFYNDVSLRNVTINGSPTSIGSSVFYGCSALSKINIPSSVTTIGSGAFTNCNSLVEIAIDRPQDSISGAPWGAPNATVVWTG